MKTKHLIPTLIKEQWNINWENTWINYGKDWFDSYSKTVQQMNKCGRC